MRIDTRGVEEVFDLLVERAPVAFEAKDLVAALVDDLLGNVGLAAHGIDGHNAALELKQSQQLGNRGDLVGFLLARLLAQHQAVAVAPGAEHVQGLEPAATIPGSPRSLAIERHEIALDGLGDRLRPTEKRSLKGFGVPD